MESLKIAATGMGAQQLRVDTIANNLANMSTTAYNARRAEFADLHYRQDVMAGTVSASDGTVLPTGVQVGLGVRPAAISVQLSQGASSRTGGDLDVAIEGRGYLEVELPNGQAAYTRAGALKRSPDGQIVTADGFPLVPDITIPDDARSISIAADGSVNAFFDDQTAPEELGRFALAAFSNEKGLEAMGDNLFLETEASGPPLVGDPGTDGLGLLRQGYLEDSSVDAVKELTDLIAAQRAYELNAKVITAADQMLSTTTQIR